eukprot:6144313-Prymnesium_polylepis.1
MRPNPLGEEGAEVGVPKQVGHGGADGAPRWAALQIFDIGVGRMRAFSCEEEHDPALRRHLRVGVVAVRDRGVCEHRRGVRVAGRQCAPSGRSCAIVGRRNLSVRTLITLMSRMSPRTYVCDGIRRKSGATLWGAVTGGG